MLGEVFSPTCESLEYHWNADPADAAEEAEEAVGKFWFHIE
jgi:hypothetical protein